MVTFDERLAQLDGGRVLDVGTGPGDFARGLAEGLASYREIIGIDTSESRINEARHQVALNRVRFELMDATQLQFASESFDTAAISNTLHHLRDPRLVLSEMKRVLKPGGVMVVVEAYQDGQDDAQMSHVLIHHWWAEIDTLLGVCHKESYRRADVISLVDELALKRMEVYDYREADDNPHDADRIATINGLIDRYIERISTCPQQEDLVKRGEELRQRIYTIGFSWSMHACLLAWK